MEKQTKLSNVVQSDALYREKLRAVEEFLGSPAAEYLPERCADVWTLVQDYYEYLVELVQKQEFLKEIELKLGDPNLSPKEEAQWKELREKIIHYMEALKQKIKKLEKRIIEELKLIEELKCMPAIPAVPPVQVVYPPKPCSELSKLIESIDTFIITRIEKQLRKARSGAPWLMAHLGFIGYTDHGLEHVDRVLKNAEKITSELGIALNDLEKAILKIAAYYHDYSMNSLTPLIRKELPEIKSRDEIRKEHASLGAQQWIEDFEKDYKAIIEIYVSSKDAEKIKNVVAEIIKNHSGDFNHYADKHVRICDSGIPIRVPLLSAILRLADEIDIGYYRLPHDVTIGATIVLGLCDDEYAKSLPHYMTNVLVDYADIEGNKLTIAIHPLKEDAVVFYPNVTAKRVALTYTSGRHKLEIFMNILNIPKERRYAVKDILIEKLEKELGLINGVLRSYGFQEIKYELTESIPVNVAVRFDRDLIYRGFRSFIKMGIGKKLLDSCEDWKKIKSEEDIYITVKVR